MDFKFKIPAIRFKMPALPESVREKVYAFFCGDVTVMGFTFIKIPDELIGIWWKIFITIVLGAAGGFAGLAGKDIYTWVKAYMKSKLLKSK